MVVSGSCSPVTARQIDWATANPFAVVAVPPGGWMGDRPDGVAEVSAEVNAHLAAGRSVIVHAALGPDDPRTAVVRRAGVTDTGPRLGRYLGTVLDEVLARGVRRVCVAGGDTSGFVARELGVKAFEFVAPIAPGSPLCRMHAPGRPADGAEICFKGGQVGKGNFFELVRAGKKQQ